MLAEPRRKQRFGVDPRGLSWSNDETKFGQKLMEKFGWEKGRGLGANEDGSSDHITVQFKDREDMRGVGCTKKYDDNWVAHQDDFNALLASLQQENTSTATSSVASTPPNEAADAEDGGVIGLEQKSKRSKRVHYGKFTRGKDLSKAQSEDLNCIFGKRKNSKDSTAGAVKEEKAEKTPEPAAVVDEVGSSVTAHGVTTIATGTSVAEYFAKKMAALKHARQAGGVAITSQEADPSKPNKKRKFDHCAEEEIHTESVEDAPAKKKKKKKDRKQEAQDETAEQEELLAHELDAQCPKTAVLSVPDTTVDSAPLAKKNKKSKKSRKHSPSLEATQSTSPEETLAQTVIAQCPSAIELSHAPADSITKKKKKSKKSKEIACVAEVSESSMSKGTNGEEKEIKLKVQEDTVNSAVAEIAHKKNVDVLPTGKPALKRKKSKSQPQERTYVEAPTTVQEIDLTSEEPKKKKKKSSKNKLEDDAVEVTRKEVLECGFAGSNAGAIAGYGRTTSVLVPAPDKVRDDEYKLMVRKASKENKLSMKKRLKLKEQQTEIES